THTANVKTRRASNVLRFAFFMFLSPSGVRSVLRPGDRRVSPDFGIVLCRIVSASARIPIEVTTSSLAGIFNMDRIAAAPGAATEPPDPSVNSSPLLNIAATVILATPGSLGGGWSLRASRSEAPCQSAPLPSPTAPGLLDHVGPCESLDASETLPKE